MRTRLILALLCILGLAAPAHAAGLLDETPRTAVMSAFPAELSALAAATTDQHRYTAGGSTFITGALEGRPVVLFESGMSMVNAAMTTERVIDRFNVIRIVFSGIAGGVDPDLDVGDVVVADQWAQYLESIMAREVGPGKFEPPPLESGMNLAPYGMMYPRGVQLNGEPGKAERRLWFPADPALVAIARNIVPGVALKRCVANLCLVKAPKVVVGGNGVSGQSFVDNASLRTYAYKTFQARVLDMETAAVAQVAYVNAVPFIAFRSLSDLAGGDPGQNQARVFFQIAADNSAAVVQAFVRALP